MCILSVNNPGGLWQSRSFQIRLDFIICMWHNYWTNDLLANAESVWWYLEINREQHVLVGKLIKGSTKLCNRLFAYLWNVVCVCGGGVLSWTTINNYDNNGIPINCNMIIHPSFHDTSVYIPGSNHSDVREYGGSGAQPSWHSARGGVHH